MYRLSLRLTAVTIGLLTVALITSGCDAPPPPPTVGPSIYAGVWKEKSDGDGPLSVFVLAKNGACTVKTLTAEGKPGPKEERGEGTWAIESGNLVIHAANGNTLHYHPTLHNDGKVLILSQSPDDRRAKTDPHTFIRQ